MAEPEAVGLDPKKLEAVKEKMEADSRQTTDRWYGGNRTKGKGDTFRDLRLAKPGGGITGREGCHFSIYSMTKAITSMAALMLWEEKELELDDPLSKFFPSLKKMRYGRMET